MIANRLIKNTHIRLIRGSVVFSQRCMSTGPEQKTPEYFTSEDIANINLNNSWVGPGGFTIARLSSPFRDTNKYVKFIDRLLVKTNDAQTRFSGDPAPLLVRAAATSVYMGTTPSICQCLWRRQLLELIISFICCCVDG